MTLLAHSGKRPAFAPSACSALNDDFAFGPGMGLAAVRCSARGSVANLARRTFETNTPRDAAWRAEREQAAVPTQWPQARAGSRALLNDGPAGACSAAFGSACPVQRHAPTPAPRALAQPRSMDAAMTDVPQQTKSKAGAPASQPWVRAPHAAALSLSDPCFVHPKVEKYRPRSLDDVVAHKEIVDTSACLVLRSPPRAAF